MPHAEIPDDEPVLFGVIIIPCTMSAVGHRHVAISTAHSLSKFIEIHCSRYWNVTSVFSSAIKLSSIQLHGRQGAVIL